MSVLKIKKNEENKNGESLMEPILIVRSLTYECQYIMDSVPTTSKPHNSVRAVLFLRYVLSRQLWVPETPLKCTSSNNHKYWCYYSNSFTSDSTIYVPYFCSIRNTWLKHTLWNRLFSEDIMEMKKKKCMVAYAPPEHSIGSEKKTMFACLFNHNLSQTNNI